MDGRSTSAGKSGLVRRKKSLQKKKHKSAPMGRQAARDDMLLMNLLIMPIEEQKRSYIMQEVLMGLHERLRALEAQAIASRQVRSNAIGAGA